ncbi:MAG: hypothetical protein V3W45_06500 [Sedimentisphaerales bacterium]
MARIAYQDINFRGKSLQVIEMANSIIAEYQAEGYDLTLRQLYYQFVARDIIPNSDREYKNLGNIVNRARLAGRIDWDAITDRTRTPRSNNHFDNPGEILDAAANTYRIDTRIDQDDYIEVWIEKDALVGVIERVCCQLDVPYLSCRGYISQSAMWESAQRILARERTGKCATVLHLGDHDPSGIDMTRDIQERLELFGTSAEVRRIALNMDQIEQYDPPPNPAKMSDTRYRGYILKYGHESWELDALHPKVISGLVTDEVDAHSNQNKIQAMTEKQQDHRERLQHLADNWELT